MDFPLQLWLLDLIRQLISEVLFPILSCLPDISQLLLPRTSGMMTAPMDTPSGSEVGRGCLSPLHQPSYFWMFSVSCVLFKTFGLLRKMVQFQSWPDVVLLLLCQFWFQYPEFFFEILGSGCVVICGCKHDQNDQNLWMIDPGVYKEFSKHLQHPKFPDIPNHLKTASYIPIDARVFNCQP